MNVVQFGSLYIAVDDACRVYEVALWTDNTLQTPTSHEKLRRSKLEYNRRLRARRRMWRRRSSEP